MKILRIAFLIIAIALASYSLFTKDFQYMSYFLLFLGASSFVTGLVELQKDRKSFEGYMFIGVSLFVFFVSTQVYLYN